MRCYDEDDRQEAPEKCDQCLAKTDLTRYVTSGAELHITWTCSYCNSSWRPKDTVDMAAMFNVLEKRLKEELPKMVLKAEEEREKFIEFAINRKLEDERLAAMGEDL